ncbi:MAG TPA: cytochrome c oxidase assembly protein [Steroidobacteraceae bacterium]|nr:cytochrome c oxidase assembly protein [Steroidobacteraceae bacterium]
MQNELGQEVRKENRKLALQLTVFAACFLAFGFALVPLYDVLCDITGYGNRENLTKASVVSPSTQTASREITVEYMSTMPQQGDWVFKPVHGSAKVMTGQLVAATFIARNLLSQPATGQAVPSLSPNEASRYFHKTECFCFTPQKFEAGQERELTVRFVVDPDLPPNVDRITLAYSMFGVAQKVADATQALGSRD